MGRLSDAIKRASQTEAPEVPAGVAAPELPDWTADLAQSFPEEQPRDAAPDAHDATWDFASEADRMDTSSGAGTADPGADAAAGIEADRPHAEDALQAASQAPATPATPAASGGAETTSSLFQRVDLRYARKVVVDDQMMAGPREQYRRLAAALHHAQEANGIKVVMIASALPGEGKTLTASNLALTLSESYRRQVLLIDGDLRKPSLHTMFRVTGTPGLSEGLQAPDGVKLPLRQISSRLTLLTAGEPSGDPMAGLTSSRMRRLIEEARQAFDWVVIDTSPIALLTDASLLAAMVDCALLVVKAGTTPFDMVRRATEVLGPEKVAGVVLNQADARDQPYGAAYAYGYPYGSTSADRTALGG
jgi:capsular exopolysaccharide synthesis family protein